MFRFQHIEYLFVLAAVPLLLFLYFFVLNWKKKTAGKIGDERLVKEMIKDYSPKKFTLKFVLIVTAFMLGVLALANLRSPKGVEKVNRNGIDIMIALDVSKSMMAQDIKPNRLDRAKQVIGKLIDNLENDRIGIVLFAGRAYLQMPLTGDHGAAKMYLSSASTEIVPTQGTVIADALKMCYSAFNSKEKKYKAIVLISDGEDHDEGALKTAEQMTAEGIVINTVGIGSPQGSTITEELTGELKKDNNGNTVITRLNEEELKKIAEKGNGMYQLFTDTDDLVSKLSTQLENMDERTIIEDSLVNYKNYFPYFLAAAVLLLVIELLVSERKKPNRIKLKVAKKTAGLTSLLLIAYCLLPVASLAQTEKALIRKGNEAYEKKEYASAVEHYQKATVKTPSSATAQYNLGNALYKNKKPDDAVQAYDNAVSNATTKVDRSKAFYNKGVVQQNNKKLPECIEAYKNALKLDPQDEDARQNLQKALQQQKQEQQKKNKEQQKPREDQTKKKQQKPKEDEKKDKPKPQLSKLTKQDAEEKLKALLQQEKNLQDRLRRMNTSSSVKPEKDW